MTDDPGTARRTLSARTYRAVDRATKLGGVALVAGGLELGLTTTPGALLGGAGALLATLTVFFHHA